MNRSFFPAFVLALSLCCASAASQPPDTAALKSQALTEIQSRYADYKKIALQIWDYAEVGYKEVKSSALLQKTLSDNGFTVQAGVADIPTAFVASYGSGSPVIGILAEFDALPGLAQQSVPGENADGKGRPAGHGCGPQPVRDRFGGGRVEVKNLIADRQV